MFKEREDWKLCFMFFLRFKYANSICHQFLDCYMLTNIAHGLYEIVKTKQKEVFIFVIEDITKCPY